MTIGDRTEITDRQGILMAYKISTNIPEELCAYSNDEDYLQLLSWNYHSGKKLQPHKHLNLPRTCNWTQEAVIVLQGSISASIFDNEKTLLDKVIVRSGECIVLLLGYHGYDILNDNTKVLELKNGPYAGAEKDRVRM